MIIQKQPNPSGAYPAPQTWHSNKPPVGYAIIDLDMTDFYAYNGFVTLTIEGDTVTAYEPNVEAWEEWKASLPAPEEPVPTFEEDATAMLVDHEYRLALLEVGLV